MSIPWLDLKPQNRAVKDEILALWSEILDSAGFIGGAHVEGFEKEFAAACGTADSVTVGDGTDALRFLFMALGLAPGDEVVTVPHTFIATTEAISQAGGRPVFVDVRRDDYCMDPALIERAITPRTKGIVPVHLYGQMADMDAILAIAKAHGLWVVEDACQAHLAEYNGRRAGSIGAGAAFSFYPGKNLGACGEAGAVTTNDPAIAARIRMIRDHGQAKKYYHDIEGYNGRCDAIQAAALRVKLRRLPEWTDQRRALAARYRERLAGDSRIVLPQELPGRKHVYHLFIALVDDRDTVAERMKEAGVMTGLHYPVPLHLQKAYAGMGLGEGSFPVSEEVARRLITLPMFPELTMEQVDRVCDALKAAVR